MAREFQATLQMKKDRGRREYVRLKEARFLRRQVRELRFVTGGSALPIRDHLRRQ
jgi:hypothetical protein